MNLSMTVLLLASAIGFALYILIKEVILDYRTYILLSPVLIVFVYLRYYMWINTVVAYISYISLFIWPIMFIWIWVEIIKSKIIDSDYAFHIYMPTILLIPMSIAIIIVNESYSSVDSYSNLHVSTSAIVIGFCIYSTLKLIFTFMLVNKLVLSYISLKQNMYDCVYNERKICKEEMSNNKILSILKSINNETELR